MRDVDNEQMQDSDVVSTSCSTNVDTIQIRWIQDRDVSTSSHIKHQARSYSGIQDPNPDTKIAVSGSGSITDIERGVDIRRQNDVCA
jgi:hypothetical protein